MNEKAFQSLQWAIDTAELMPVDRMDVQQSTRDGHAKFLQEARTELVNARKLLEAAEDLLAAHHHSRSDDYVHDVRVLIIACRVETGKNQNA